ncbi:hypothetical protein CKM354_000615500 [Cercospora kikuchii]|uniref:Apple domain-containing protein n=1 Tax=Cercospora kikuchii TaxID=84275 RepID=A0A9P3CK78_9PEZI|nr:uncharacterized protein CKM354_000615500 [Cercospora kikuchii]GIZ42907.1 hypothetical protein CKM354_000615500 [Cercospora kikuchii]
MHYSLTLNALLAAAASAGTLARRTYSIPNYNLTYTNQATINAPTDCGSYITYKSHPADSYDPSLCAADCDGQRAETPNHYNGLTCHFFTSYQLLKNGVVQNQICALYSRTWDSSYATNTGYTSGSDTYTIQNAYSWSYSDPGTFTCPQTGGNQPQPPSNGPLTTCPTQSQYIVGANFILYRICLDTDYQIPSPQITYGDVDNRACANECSKQQGCTKAVFNLGTQTCYLKGSPSVADSNWQKNAGFQTVDRVPVDTPMGSSCLAPLYTIKQNGVTYTVCPSSHLNNAQVLNYWNNVSGEYVCAQKCQSVSGCKKFVYDWGKQTCYNVGNVDFSKAGWATFDNVGTYWAQ